MSQAIVVGSGPNGLTCAVALARAGVSVTVLEAADEIGGGTRTSELTVPGVLHDHCSAVHPMAVGSPFLRSLELDKHGLEWRWPEIDLAHPLDDGSAGVLRQSIDETVAGLGEDGPRWRGVFGPLVDSIEVLSPELMKPFLHVPKHPIRLTRFGLRAGMPAGLLARRFKTPQARALFMGAAAHALSSMHLPMSSAIGVALIAHGHQFGWAVAKGGSRAITDALASVLAAHGGRIETGRRVTSLDELPDADIVALDLTPRAVAEIAGDKLPGRVARAYGRYKHGPGAFKVDLAVAGGVPWTNEACRAAGTVHVVGSSEELAVAEREINQGRMPDRPCVLVSQQYLADPGRSAGDVHPIWSYAHVPNGYSADATEVVIGQIERFAPGLRERIVGTSVTRTDEFEGYNANFIGGDIVTGANTPWQIPIRPRLAPDPYATGIPGVYICSAATPPGAGVHGMCGLNAAESALRHLG